MKWLATVISTFLVSSSVMGADTAAPDWVKVTDKAAVAGARFQRRGRLQGSALDPRRLVRFLRRSAARRLEFARRQKLEPRDQGSALEAQRFADDARLQGSMWLMGGWFNGRLKGHSASNEVWSSADGANWEQVAKEAGWSPGSPPAPWSSRGECGCLAGPRTTTSATRRA